MLKNYINGSFVSSPSTDKFEVINPSNLKKLAETPLCSAAEVDRAVGYAQEAFLKWSNTPVVDRVQPLFKLKRLLEKHFDIISQTLVEEHGKTLKEARGDLLRGLQMVEVACGMPSLMQGDCLDNVASGIDSYATRRPLGVFAGINPFNFPAMVPFWFWPFAVASGNSFIVKPSERVPLTQMKIFELIDECGFPPGVINLLHGGKDVVNGFLNNEIIKGVCFVGSTPVAKHVYSTGCANGKRVQALGGAKNFLVMMPDAPLEKSVKAMVESCYGCAGERCLAGSVLIGVGKAYEKLKELVLNEAQKVVVGDGLDEKTTMGPVISQEAKDRICSDIETAEKEGGVILMDGRKLSDNKLKGFFLGPTIIDNVKPGTLMGTKEIFGPVIGLMKAESLDEAIDVINSSEYANTTSIFTSNGGAARKFSQMVSPSMVGVNLGVPAPMAFFSFGGSKSSFYGDIKVHGKSSVEFFTEKHTVMTRWFDESTQFSVNPLWSN